MLYCFSACLPYLRLAFPAHRGTKQGTSAGEGDPDSRDQVLPYHSHDGGASYKPPQEMASPIYSLPTELIDAIIDELHNDQAGHSRSVLKSCSLACKLFIPRTRQHLLRDITISSNRQCKDFLALCRSSRHVSTSPTTLTIIWTVNHRLAHTMSTRMDFPALLRILSNLNQIKLSGMDWTSLSPKFIDSLATHSFRSITLMHTHFTDSNAFYSFLSRSPNLRQISCFMTTIDNNDRPPFSANFDASCRPHINGLSLRKMRQIPEMVLSPTLSPLNLDRLRVLDVLLEEDHHFDLARRFIDSTTHSLEVLRVSQFDTPPEDRSECFPIQHLKSITVEMMDYHLGRITLPTELSIFQWWIRHFESYPDVQCSCVNFLVHTSTYNVRAEADYTAWRDLDAVLSRCSVSSLVIDVSVSKASVVEEPSNPISVQLAIERNLPILMSRKVAHVQISDTCDDSRGINYLVN
ncbi:hypothetical protein ARMGADRAFT_94877 [Armillaria gallica]|uniref:F-box domain-containing protein n=1 Tax=Armillaria gallica TaxID=47427 RepID=A0A2H3CA67_ARMGA|nr:hypothetical protein ARMGADRAFT_94877 [Armillaria gallica]